jgi:superfamily II RNA helicase
MEGELADLRKAMKNHPSHGCAEREDHARLAERAGRLTRENNGLTIRVESRTHVIAKTFDQICRVLDHLQYIEGEKPTAQGKILTKIYAESDLLLTESIRRGNREKGELVRTEHSQFEPNEPQSRSTKPTVHSHSEGIACLSTNEQSTD